MTDVDWDALQVGDPDPTPDDPPWCELECPHWLDVVCTREAGHDGPHVAGQGIVATAHVDFGRSVVAIWPSDG